MSDVKEIQSGNKVRFLCVFSHGHDTLEHAKTCNQDYLNRKYLDGKQLPINKPSENSGPDTLLG